MQVYELAIELGVRSADIVARAGELGVGELTPTDSLTAQQVRALRDAYGFGAGDQPRTAPEPAGGQARTSAGPERPGSSGALVAKALLVLVVGATVTMFAWLAINDEPPEQADAAEASTASDDPDELDFNRRDVCAAWGRFEIRGEAASGEVLDAVTLAQVMSELEATRSALGEAYVQLKPFTEGEERELLTRYHSIMNGLFGDALAASSLEQTAQVLNDPQRNQAADETWQALKTRYEDC